MKDECLRPKRSTAKYIAGFIKGTMVTAHAQDLAGEELKSAQREKAAYKKIPSTFAQKGGA